MGRVCWGFAVESIVEMEDVMIDKSEQLKALLHVSLR